MQHIILLFTFLFSLSLAAQELDSLVPIPSLEGRIIDQVSLLTESGKEELESKLRALEDQGIAQFVVLILPSTGEESIETYSMRVVEEWKLGSKDLDNGILLLIAFKDRKIRIEVGYGLESKLSDMVSSRIIREQIQPYFQKGEFEKGIHQGVFSIIQVLDGQNLEELPKSEEEISEDWQIFIIILVLSYLVSKFIGLAIEDSAFFFSWILSIILTMLFSLSLIGTSNWQGFLLWSVLGYLLLETMKILRIWDLLGILGGGSGSSSSGGGGSFGGGGASGSW